MRYEEIIQAITASSPGDWQRIDRLGAPIWPGEHPYVAVYKPDADLRLAWGLRGGDDVELQGWKFPGNIEQHLADALWRGALIARWSVLAVDNLRGYLPQPYRSTAEAGEAGSGAEHVGWTVKKSETAVPRLLHSLNPEHGGRDFDSYLEQSGTVEVDG